MNKSFIFDNDKFLDTKGIVHNKKKLSEILDYKKSSIDIGLESNTSYTVSATWTYSKAKCDIKRRQKGSGLEFKDGWIVVGKNISEVEVSLTALVRGIIGTQVVGFFHNDRFISFYINATNASSWTTKTIASIPLDVKEGDIISLGYGCSGTGALQLGGGDYTHLIVKEI